MPKLMQKIIIDEKRLVELIKKRPELYDPLNEYSKDNNRKKIAWKEVSLEINASVDLVKRVWRKLRINYERCCKDQDERKSARLNPHETNLEFLRNIRFNAHKSGVSNVTTTNENSANFEPPKRVLRSGLQLPTITGIESTSLKSSFDLNKTQAIIFHDNEHQESTFNGTHDQTNQKDERDTREPLNNLCKQENNQNQMIVEKPNRTLRQRQLVILTDAIKENNSPIRSSRTISKKAKNKQKKFIDFRGATRPFFENIAMTVSSFPEDYQSSIKMEIYNIVTKAQNKLSSKKKS